MTEHRYETIHEDGGAPIKMWTRGVPVEDSAREQLVQTAALPFVWPHVAVMPDVHWGMGATVGSVVPTKGAIVPACVGVDLGCGMMAGRLNLTSSALGDNAEGLYNALCSAIPHGRTDNGGANDRGARSGGARLTGASFRTRISPGCPRAPPSSRSTETRCSGLRTTQRPTAT